MQSSHCYLVVNERLFLPSEDQFKVETKTIAVDFGKTDIYSKIEEGLAGLEIGVLGKNCYLFLSVQCVYSFFYSFKYVLANNGACKSGQRVFVSSCLLCS